MENENDREEQRIKKDIELFNRMLFSDMSISVKSLDRISNRELFYQIKLFSRLVIKSKPDCLAHRTAKRYLKEAIGEKKWRNIDGADGRGRGVWIVGAAIHGRKPWPKDDMKKTKMVILL